MAELYGRRRVVRFVADGLDRSRNRDTPPIVLLIGVRGTGKTLLLDELELAHRGVVPTARLDFEDAADIGPAPILLSVVSELGEPVPRIGKVRFPRLNIGLIAISLDPEDPDGPEEQLRKRLSDRRYLTGEALAKIIRDAADLMPVPERHVIGDAGAVIGWVVDGIRRRKRDEYVKWYATAAGRGDGSQFGPLLYLYQQWRKAIARHEEDTSVSHEGTGAEILRDDARRDAGRLVWRALCRALLADLREGFNKAGLTHGVRTANCLVLLDNADAAVSTEFIETLAECREESPRETDPLLVVAAKRTLPGRRPDVGTPVPVVSDDLSHAAWLARSRHEEDERSQWYPVLLTELSESNVESVVQSHVLGRKWRDADLVYTLTGGHPAAAQILARRLSAVDQGFDVRDLVDSEAENELLSVLRPEGSGPSDQELDAMALLSVGCRPSSNAGTAVFQYLDETGVRESDIRELILRLMWGREDGGLTLDPLPRFLLSRRLARSRTRWEMAHTGFVNHYRTDNNRDEIMENYHHMALTVSRGLNNVPRVADFLSGQLGDWPLGAWNNVLAVITSAPNRLRLADQERTEREFTGAPEDTVKYLAGVEVPDDPRQVISRLITARWLYNDRLFDPGRRLARLLEQEYFALTELTTGNNEVLFQEASHFRRIAREWEDRL